MLSQFRGRNPFSYRTADETQRSHKIGKDGIALCGAIPPNWKNILPCNPKPFSPRALFISLLGPVTALRPLPALHALQRGPDPKAAACPAAGKERKGGKRAPGQLYRALLRSGRWAEERPCPSPTARGRGCRSGLRAACRGACTRRGAPGPPATPPCRRR